MLYLAIIASNEMHKKKTTLQILEFVQGDHTVVTTNLLDFVHNCTEVEITLLLWGFSHADQ